MHPAAAPDPTHTQRDRSATEGPPLGAATRRSNPHPRRDGEHRRADTSASGAQGSVPERSAPRNSASERGGSERSVLEADDVARALTRIAHEILERNRGPADVVLLGIPTRGVPLARRLGARIAAVESAVAVGALDVTMYRDDLRLRPARALERTDLPDGGVDEKVVVLVDDVLFSGRTIRAALDAIGDLGRPRAVQLAVLVDRGHRQLPIRADFVGKNLPTALRETVHVLLTETDGRDAVLISADPIGADPIGADPIGADPIGADPGDPTSPTGGAR